MNYGAGFSPPAINASGKTAFLGALAGDGVDESNNRGVWAERGGATALVARLGSPAPGTAGATFTGLAEPLFNDAGQTAFFGFDGRQGIWAEGSGALVRVVHSGADAAGTPSGFIFIYRYGQFDSLAFNNAGKTAFAASIDSPTGPISFGLDDKAAWTDRDGSVQMYVRGGWQAPGAPSGVQYVYTRDIFGYGEEFKPALNNYGRIAFQTRLRGTGVTTATNRGIWSDGSGTMGMVARSGSQAPSAPDGVNFAGFGFATPALNDAGRTAFFATLAGGAVTSADNQGVWSEGAGGLRMVARSGSQAPGADVGVNFAFFNAPIALNEAGQTAFGAGLTGTGDVAPTGIWSEGGGSLALVARTGQAAPGADAGLSFSEFSLPALNDRGQSAFSALLAGGLQGTTGRGVWATNSMGALQLIVRTGALFEVAPGDSRTVSDVGFSPDDGFNNKGQVAFSATFTDGSQGVFVSNLVAVPEPASLALGALAGIVGLAMRRPRTVRRLCARIKIAPTVAVLLAIAGEPAPARGHVRLLWQRRQ